MSQQTSPPPEIVQASVEEEQKRTKQAEASLKELLDSLRRVQGDIGQICELISEEKSFVAQLFESLSKLMQPLASTVPVSVAALPEGMGSAVQASVDPTGHLIISYRDGRVELEDLRKEANRDLMIRVIRDIMPKFKQLASAYRQKIEQRIKFLSLVTEELQKISEAFSTATT